MKQIQAQSLIVHRSTNPTTSDNASRGFDVESEWYNGILFFKLTSFSGSDAIWEQIGGGNLTETVILGQDVGAGKILALRLDGYYWLADCRFENVIKSELRVAKTSGLSGGNIEAYVYGRVPYPSLTAGVRYYVGQSGNITDTPTTTVGEFQRYVGASEGVSPYLTFNPDQNYYQVASGGTYDKISGVSIGGSIGYTAENVTNKSDSYTASSSTTYASTKALVDGKAATLASANAYTDSVVEGLQNKPAAKGATVSSLPSWAQSGTYQILTATANGIFPIIDGVTYSVSEDIIVKDETDQKANGIFRLTQAGSVILPWILTRRNDANTGSELQNATVEAQLGTINGGLVNEGTNWRQVTPNVVIGTSNIVFSQFGVNTPDATETVKGKIEIATQSETHAGSDDLRAITPLKLATEKDSTGGIVGLTLFKINFKNVLNTFTSFFTNSNTAARTYTFPDRSITVQGTDEANVATNYTTPLDADKMGIWDTVNGLFKSVTWANIKATLKTYFDTLYVLISDSRLTDARNTLAGVNNTPYTLVGGGNVTIYALRSTPVINGATISGDYAVSVNTLLTHLGQSNSKKIRLYVSTAPYTSGAIITSGHTLLANFANVTTVVSYLNSYARLLLINSAKTTITTYNVTTVSGSGDPTVANAVVSFNTNQDYYLTFACETDFAVSGQNLLTIEHTRRQVIN